MPSDWRIIARFLYNLPPTEIQFERNSTTTTDLQVPDAKRMLYWPQIPVTLEKLCWDQLLQQMFQKTTVQIIRSTGETTDSFEFMYEL